MEKLSKEQIEFLYSPISKQEQKAQKDRFIAKFSPVLTQNGFIKKGAGFFRIYGDNIFQWVELWHPPFFPRQLYIECNAEPLYFDYVRLLELDPEPESAVYQFQNRQNSVSHERNIGRSLESFLGYANPLRQTITPFFTTTNFDEALEEEFHLFVDEGLPRLNSIMDVPSFIREIPFECFGYAHECMEGLSISWLTVIDDLEHHRYTDAVDCLHRMIDMLVKQCDQLEKEMALLEPDWKQQIIELNSTNQSGLDEKQSNLLSKYDLILRKNERISYRKKIVALLESGDEQAIKAYKARYHRLAYEDMNLLSPRIMKNPVKPKL